MQQSTRGRFLAVIFFTLMAVTSAPAIAVENKENKGIGEALQGDWGQIKVNLRYRYEQVDQDGLKTGKGDPLRLRLGYLSPKFGGFQAYGEFLGNSPIFFDDFNDTSNGKSEYAVISDPNEAALNQAWISFESIPASVIKGGRQKISWDNERFICPAGWRQMEQTFDAVTLLNKSLGDLTVRAGYIWSALLVNNEEVNMQSPLINLNYSLRELGSLAGYGYWLDYSDADDSGPFPYAYSSQTYGLRLNGSPAISDGLRLLYTAEYAGQSGYRDNPKDFTADYYHLSTGLLAPLAGSFMKNLTGSIGYEVFGSDSAVSFQTPLGANHKYNGWADIFGRTKPATGLRDLYGSLSSTIGGVKVDLVYHDFQADAGSIDHGTEFDVKLTKNFGKYYSVLVSYAVYNADQFKEDTDKLWLQLTVNF